VAADQFDQLFGLCLAPAALLDECLDAGFDDARDAAVSKALGRNELLLINSTKHRLTSLQLGDRRPALKGLARLGHVLGRDNDRLGLVLRCLRHHQRDDDAALVDGNIDSVARL
jgi:hypothetical protein